MRHAACALAARRSVGRSALIGLLVFALLVYGGSSTLLSMLGPMHRHAPAAGVLTQSLTALAGNIQQWHRQALPQSRDDQARQRERAAAWAVALEQFDDPGHARQHASGQVHEHVHEHGLFERHLHDPADASVIALDGHGSSHTDALSAAASLGSATLPMAIASLLIVPAPAGRHARWPRPAATAWHSLVPTPAERPPRG